MNTMTKERPRAAVPDPAALQEQEAFCAGYHSFIWGYPYVKGTLLRRVATHPASPNHAPVNQVHYYTTLARPGFHDFTPTVEALMNVGWLDLSQGPVLVEVPRIEDRYWSVVVTDQVGDEVVYLGSRMNSAAGVYAFVPCGWEGALPAGAIRIDVRSRFALILLRTLVAPSVAGDLEACVALHAAMTLRPLDPAARYAPVSPEAPLLSARPESAVFHTLDFFALLNGALDEGGIMPGEDAVAAQFAPFGIGPGRRFDAARLSEAQRAGLLRGMQAAHQRILAELGLGAVDLGGWQFNFDVGRYGHRFVTRATVALFGYGAMVPEEALYVTRDADDARRALDGAHRYEIAFAADQLPPVEAFWSITVYTRPGNQLVANEIDRYSISSETPGLVRGADGTLTLILQHARPETPGEAANWLPVPEGAFWLILRTYVPQAPLLERRYTPPPVRRLG